MQIKDYFGLYSRQMQLGAQLPRWQISRPGEARTWKRPNLSQREGRGSGCPPSGPWWKPPGTRIPSGSPAAWESCWQGSEQIWHLIGWFAVHAPSPSLCPTPFENEDNKINRWEHPSWSLKGTHTSFSFWKNSKTDIILPPRRRRSKMACSAHGPTSQGEKQKDMFGSQTGNEGMCTSKGGEDGAFGPWKRFRGSEFLRLCNDFFILVYFPWIMKIDFGLAFFASFSRIVIASRASQSKWHQTVIIHGLQKLNY